ncbi:MAG TPA: MBL fold metallo-hydrolase [Patescibacteria group bacterium]|nr:MBL fold metallo-hydrolase [Patescibacteria group bacterium]
MQDDQNGFEVDYIHVGTGSRSGDAIALRFGNLNGPRSEQTVIVIDGGTQESGDTLVQHIKDYYHTDHVDYVVSTHQDSDHISGLKVVLEELSVDYLLMHIPWEHEDEINSLFENSLGVGEFESELQNSLENVRDIEEIAIEKEIAIVEPFEGTKNSEGSIHVLGPSLEFYCSLVPNFRGTPEARNPVTSALDAILGRASEAISTLRETLDPSTETLDDNGRFTPENESSVILLITVGEKKLLFTGDAGITALTKAADYADSVGISLTDLHLFHVPHHGSRQNVGPTILNRIKATNSQISASLQGAPKHPSKRVINALKRRQSAVYVTKGQTTCYPWNAPSRLGWGPVAEEEFNFEVEGDND